MPIKPTYFKDFRRVGGSLLDLLFPPTCALCKGSEGEFVGAHLCVPCAQSMSAPLSDALIPGLWSAGDYSGTLRSLILRAKFSTDTGSACALSSFLGLALQSPASPQIHADVITTIPGSPRRIRERNMDLPFFLARSLARHFDIPFKPNLLRRIRETPSQTALGRTERLKNLEGCFAANFTGKGQRILVVDDVTTTGATAHVATEALLGIGAVSVMFITVAHTDHRHSPTL